MPIHGYPGNVITANPTAPTSSVASGVWTTEQQLLAISQGNWPGYQYPVERSLRFNSADSAYLNRTPASASNRKTWTWSGWIKRSGLSNNDMIFMGRSNGTNYDQIRWNSDNTIYFFGQNAAVDSYRRNTTPVYRDTSSWYHLVGVFDSTNATAANRVKLYINGVEVTAFSSSSNPSLNYDSYVDATNVHFIGGNNIDGMYSNQYITEVNFIDGQALTPSSFGQINASTGVWEPINYTGTYGTNGFYLNFSDNSNTTAATLGKDYSGNGNNWTPNNFSVTAGAGNDSLVDSPTSYGTDTGVGGEVRGNYATWNPLEITTLTKPTNGNLEYSPSGTAPQVAISTIVIPSTDKWYAEVTKSSTTGSCTIGVIGALRTAQYTGHTDSIGYFDNGQIYQNASLIQSGLATYASGDVIGVAVDAGAKTVQFYKNGSTVGSAVSYTYSQVSFACGNYVSGQVYNANFGQRPFAYTAPSGFKALCTQNLPTPTIGATSTTQANDYMNVVLWTGNGSTQNITGVGFQPDFVWAKKRSGAESHGLYDAVRGASNRLVSNTTAAAVTDAGVSAFLSDGFSISGADSGVTNDNGSTYVGWNWKANGAGSSNTAGTITSTVSANTTSGFSIVTYTGTGSNATVGHGLGVAPSMVIVKPRSTTGSWIVYATALGSANLYTVLNAVNDPYSAAPTVWNSTAPTSSVFSIGTASGVNTSTTTYVAYCFAPVAGYSAFGSYTGNGSSDGPFIYTGFRPRFVIRKCSSATSNWFINDAARDPSNVVLLRLNADLSDAESSGANSDIDFLSNGFKIRATSTAGVNQSGQTHIYMAFAESPFKFSLAR